MSRSGHVPGRTSRRSLLERGLGDGRGVQCGCRLAGGLEQQVAVWTLAHVSEVPSRGLGSLLVEVRLRLVRRISSTLPAQSLLWQMSFSRGDIKIC